MEPQTNRETRPMKTTESETPDLQPLIIPCDCGSPDAVWRGDKCGHRMYVCEDCAKLYPELNTEN
jgi:hypothetical protein